MKKSLATVLLLSSALPLAAQTPSSESLLIGPGDLLHVQFYDTPELDQHPRVDDSGKAPLLFLGPVALTGKTTEQAATFISNEMVSHHFMSHPQVLVAIDQFATQGVTITGEVARPGTYPITTPRLLLDVFGLAGGINALADRHIVVQHRGTTTQRISYFVSNDPLVQLRDSVTIYPGDVILVPRANFVYVLGDVGRPGGYPLASNEAHVTLLQLLSTAGSTNKTAIISGVRVMRKSGDGYTQIPMSLGKIEAGKEPDLTLEADDVIIVPFSYVKSLILNSAGIAASIASAVIYTH